MLGHRTLTLEDYLTILKRRWWIIAIPAVVLPLVALAISYRVTPIYTSQTLVLIEQQKVPDTYVTPVISENIDSRLSSMKEQILSRSRLQPIIERYNLGDPKATMDDRMVATQHAIQIKAIHSEISGAGGLPGFFISFQAGDAHTAQAVCREITSLFLSENMRARQASVEGTSEFIKEQLNDAKNNLDAQDAKLAAFQRQNLGSLPDDQVGNMNMLTSLNSQLDASTTALTQLEQQRDYREGLLAQQGRDGTEVSTPTRPGQRAAAQPTAEQAKELQELQAEEADLSTRYTADYPDVVIVKRKIQDLKNQIAKNPATVIGPNGTPVRNESPAILQLHAQIGAFDAAIQQKRGDQAKIQREIALYQSHIQASPLVAAQYKELTRGYDTAQKFYDSLLAKMNQSQMATDLELQQQGEHFNLLDDANLPDEPTFPKRSMFAAGGLAAGLALGFLLVALLEFRDKSLHSERDVWAFTKLPTLGIIALTGAERETSSTIPGLGWLKRRPKTPNQPLPNVGG